MHFVFRCSIGNEDPQVEWLLPLNEKREILGDTRKDGGGAAPPGSCEEPHTHTQKKATQLEPVSMHGNSVAFWREILHSYWAASATDFTVQNDNLALACIQMQVKYVGIVNNEFHAGKVRQRLIERVFMLMQDERCEKLYQPMAVSDLAGAPAAKDAATKAAPPPQIVSGSGGKASSESQLTSAGKKAGAGRAAHKDSAGKAAPAKSSSAVAAELSKLLESVEADAQTGEVGSSGVASM